MKYTKLGRTGTKVSRLCLGTMNFGPRTSEADSHRIMDRAIELGINFFDTANRYGAEVETGYTESIIGRWLAKSGRRDEIVLATKFFGPMGPGANDEGLSLYHMRAAVHASLTRLQTDRIDLYQMHHIDRGLPHPKSPKTYLDGDLSNLAYPAHLKPGTPWEEIWQGYQQLITEGKVLYAGSSNFAAWNIVQANERAAARSMLGLVTEQSKYSLMTRDIELELVPACREYGVGILPWSPLGGGALAGSAHDDGSGRRSGRDYDEATQKRREAFADVTKALGEEPPVVALAWLLHNPVVTAPIIGPRTIDQLDSAARAIDLELDAEVMERIDAIFPGPGDQAPEAYAW
ncbi:MAG TPA: aldo/keto reductase [Spirochaetia bacterium]|nr:aldo/keto reductase [Spirochaetia bacterium]